MSMVRHVDNGKDFVYDDAMYEIYGCGFLHLKEGYKGPLDLPKGCARR